MFGSLANPRRNEGDTGDRRRRRVDDIGKLFPRDLEVIRQRAGRIADDQGIRIVVEEDHQPHEPGGDLRANRGLRAADDHLDDTHHAAVARDDAHHAADHHREQDDRGVIDVGNRIGDKDLE